MADPSIKTSAANATTAASRVVTANADRASVTIQVISTATASCFVGEANTVTTSTGFEIQPGGALTLDLEPGDEVWIIAASTQAYRVLEELRGAYS